MSDKTKLIDIIYTELSKKAKMPFPLPESAVKKTIGEVIDSMESNGFEIIVTTHGKKETVDPDAVYCPHCRINHPPIGVNVCPMEFSGQIFAVLTIFCGSCRTILHANVTQAPPQPTVQ